MTWRLRITHRSTYRYGGPVRASYNEARVTPLSGPSQLVLESELTVEPAARCLRYQDYWGSIVHSFDLHEPHERMEVTARSLVETALVQSPLRALGWVEIGAPQVREEYAELLAPTPRVPLGGEFERAANELASSPSPAAAASGAISWVRERLRYVPGRTGVRTSALEALEGGEGVCQDFAHLSLALLRSAGIPARYCSGYLHPVTSAVVGTTVKGESHAWVEYWDGAWHGLDPTIGAPVGEQHVLVARGRDYADVSPLKGIYQGGPAGDLQVSVEITRMA